MKSITASKITSEKTQAAYASYVLSNYGNAPFTLVRGEGTKLWDAEGRRYLDFCSGIAVNALGHGHPKWVHAVQKQAAELVHVSNLYHIPQQAALAEALCAETGGSGKLFFCNSGAEANETMLKLARLYGVEKAGGEEGKIYKVVTAENAFHGRTFGGMSATPQAKVQKGFAPLVPGFVHAKFNDLASFEAAIDEETAAVMLETIQGEGGINVATTEFLQGLRKLCDEREVLLLIDEVQCGIGRTGDFYAYESSGIQPDAIGMAKGLGGGFPIGAVWLSDFAAKLFTPGSHGTTFGGTPLACAAALATLEVIDDEGLLNKVQAQSAPWHAALEELVSRHSDKLSGLRGRGYHVALVVKGDPSHWMGLFRESGLLTVRGGTDAIRLMPPLNVSPAELEAAVGIIDLVLGMNALPEGV